MHIVNFKSLEDTIQNQGYICACVLVHVVYYSHLREFSRARVSPPGIYFLFEKANPSTQYSILVNPGSV